MAKGIPIGDLPELEEVTSNDVIPIVDVETNTTRKITATNFASTVPHSASAISIESKTGATCDDAQCYIDRVQGSGYIEFDGFTDNGDGTVDVGAGMGFIRATNDPSDGIVAFDWDAVAAVALTDNDANYIFVNYNGGTPEVDVTLTKADVNGRNMIGLGQIYRGGTNLCILQAGMVTNELSQLVQKRLNAVDGAVNRSSGLVISETGTRNLYMTAGKIYAGLTPSSLVAKDTSATDTFTYFYQDGGGGFTQVASSTQIDNLQYDDGSGTLATLGNNRYGVHWVFITSSGCLVVVYGRDSYLLAGAEAATIPAELPTIVSDFSFIAAKIIIEKSGASFYGIESAYDVAFSSSGAVNHNDLGGIQGGAADDYFHLTSAHHTDLTDGGDTTLHGHDHDALTNYSADEHFTEASIDHANIQSIGTNSHADIDTHIADTTKHFTMLDEDDMSSDSATQAATQQSIKKYVDDEIAGVGGGGGGGAASDITMLEVGAATYDDVKDAFDTTQSGGIISGGDITDGGSGTIDIAACTGIIKSTNSLVGQNYFFDLSASSGVGLTDDSVNWVYADYNAGTPQYAVTTDWTTLDLHTQVIVGKVYRSGTTVTIARVAQDLADHQRIAMQHTYESYGLHRTSGIMLADEGSKELSTTAGVMYAAFSRIAISAIDTSGADTFTYIYRDGSGGWTEAAGTSALAASNYDNGTGVLGSLTNNHYGIHWIYIDVNSNMWVQYGQASYPTLGGTYSVEVPTPSDFLSEMAILVGKAVVKKFAGDVSYVESPYDRMFNSEEGFNPDLNEIEIGTDADATGDRSIAVGYSTLSSTTGAISIGDNAHAEGAENPIAIGDGATSTGQGSVLVGRGTADAGGIRNVIIGMDASTGASSSYSVVVGRGASSTAGNAVALGASASVTGQYGIAVGNSAANGGQGVSIGYNCQIGTGGFMLGYNQNESTVTNSIMIGSGNAVDSTQYQVKIGIACTTGATETVAIGHNTDVSTSYSVGIGTNADVTGDRGINIGASGCAGNYGIAMSPYASASGNQAIALGRAALGSGGSAVSIGYNTDATGYHAFAIAYGAQATSNYTIAIGSGATASNADSVAIGRGAATSLVDQIVLGGSAVNTSVYCNGVIVMQERASNLADVAGYHQLWVNSSDNTLRFTLDDGTEYYVDLTAV